MVVGGSILNLSNLIWTDETDIVQKERSVFLVQDFWNGDFAASDDNYFLISFGEELIEDGMTSRAYLAVLKGDGQYTLERMEEYMEKRNVDWRKEAMVFDLRKLPDEINGVKLHKAADFQRTALNRWRDGVFRSEGGDGAVWNLELKKADSEKRQKSLLPLEGET